MPLTRAARRVIDRPDVQLRLAMVRAATAVDEPVRFALNELAGRHTVRQYGLARNGRKIVLRHPRADAWVVHEVLKAGAYRPPAPVLDALRDAGPKLRIADFGGHIGTTTLLLLEHFPEADVVALEPNPENAALLRRMVELNRLGEQVRVVEAAAATEDGTAMIEGFSILSHVSREGEREAVEYLPDAVRDWLPEDDGPRPIRTVDAFGVLADRDLVKIDIEGAEWELLADARLAATPLRAIVLEYHPQSAPQADTTAAVTELLERAGFTVGEPFDVHDGVGTVWAWR